MMIMAESDFFKGHMKGVGKDKFVWKVFRKCMSTFSHMVQMSKGLVPSTRTPRTIILDEDLFRIFTHYCYLEKYGKSTRKSEKLKPQADLTYDQLYAQCARGANAKKDPEYLPPSRNKTRLWARKVLWNLRYYKNTPFGNQFSPDPFEKLDDLPYYPYIINLETNKYEQTEVVSARQKPVDEVFAQHMFKQKRKRASVVVEIDDTQKKRVIEKFDN